MDEPFILFYSIFWALALNAGSKLFVFNTNEIITRHWRRPLVRFLIAFICLNIFPLIWLKLIYAITFDGICVWQILGNGLIAVSVFSFPRFLHACVASKKPIKYFYTEKEIQSLENDSKITANNGFWNHFIPALFYLSLTGIGWLIGKLCS